MNILESEKERIIGMHNIAKKNPVIGLIKESSDCGSKTPYQAITDMGMNFKDTQLKWINANCNGTTPCIKGNSNTNLNLKDAVCSGSWSPDGGSNTSGGGGDESTSNDEVIDDGTWSGDIY